MKTSRRSFLSSSWKLGVAGIFVPRIAKAQLSDPAFVASLTTPAEAPSGFTYYSVAFDGTNDFLLRGGDPIPDSKLGLLSVWLKMDSGSDDATQYFFMGNSGNYFYMQRAGGSGIQISGFGVFGTVATVNFTKADGWIHVLSSWDAAVPTRNLIYINGVDRSPSASNTDAEVNYATGDFKIGDLAGGSSKWFGLVCEFYFTDAYLDLSSSSNRDKFYNSATGKPVDLGANGSTPTGTQPRIYLRNSFSTWQNNLGSGGNFSVTGALGDGGADKP